MRKSHLLASALVKSGALRLADAFWGPTRLTILVYHRITDVNAPNFRYFRPNVGASPALFKRQMAFVAEHFNVIDLETLQKFVLHGVPLPPRPLLITFDDGYLDNYTTAYPILRDYGFPAVIFLITGHMDNPGLPWWEQCAYYFDATARKHAQLPFIGECDLSTPAQRLVARHLFMETIKRVPEIYKQRAIDELQTILDVSPPPADSPLFVSWEQVRELVANGVACQPHTVTHPILSQIDDVEIFRQFQESRSRIEAETGQAADVFAYPNGLHGDYTACALQALRQAGFSMAFTHNPGPMRPGDARRHPFEILRVPIYYPDTFEMFVTKVMGVFTLPRHPQYVASNAERVPEMANVQDRYDVARSSTPR